MALPKRLAAAAARRELSGLLRQMSKLDEPGASIADRAVRLGIYGDDAAVLVPLSDYEQALDLERAVEDIELELLVAERLARGPRGPWFRSTTSSASSASRRSSGSGDRAGQALARSPRRHHRASDAGPAACRSSDDRLSPGQPVGGRRAQSAVSGGGSPGAPARGVRRACSGRQAPLSSRVPERA